jgi:hypothetical protein
MPARQTSQPTPSQTVVTVTSSSVPEDDVSSEHGLRMQREYFLSPITDQDFIKRYERGPYAECARRIVAIR